MLMSDGIVVEETSREGDSRKRANPAWSIFIEASKELRAQLSELQMTVRTAKVHERRRGGQAQLHTPAGI